MTAVNDTAVISAQSESETAKITIKIGETALENGAEATWTQGENRVEIKVSDGDANQTYVVTVTKA